jgi:tetratricopeptide (TPR) repeat protein
MRLIITIFSILIFLQGYSQNIDSLLYNSKYEKDIFYSYSVGKVDTLGIFLISSQNQDIMSVKAANQKISALYKKLDGLGISGLQQARKVKLIFKTVHADFLKNYKEFTSLSEIFDNGTYNCVSGSALYALVFSHYGIPFQIKEKPTHVYLVAYPDNLNILVESTLPNIGYILPTKEEKKEYVNQLVTLKFLSRDYVNQVGIDKAYNEFFYRQDESITIQNLAGIQYYNKAVESIDNKEYEKAYLYTYKADILYPSKKNKFLKVSLLGDILNNVSFTQNIHFYYLAEYANNANMEGANREAKGIFGSKMYKYLVEQQDTTFLRKAYEVFSQSISDTVFKSEITQFYYAELGKYFYNLGYFDQSIDCARKVYLLNADHSDAQMLISNSLLRGFVNGTGGIKEIKLLDENTKAYPFLKENSMILSVYLHNYCYVSINSFEKGDRTEGMKHLKSAQEILKLNNKNLRIDNLIIANMFGAAADSYMNKNDKKMAMELLNKGLEQFPDNSNLLKLKKYIESR